MMTHEKDRLIFFTTDAGYLVPTLVAAMQVASQNDVTAIADIMIALVDFDESERQVLEGKFKDISFRIIDSADFSLPDDALFHGTHVPRSALARLSASHIIDPRYRHLVYLDGDIQVIQSIYPLVAHTVEEGKILAGPDAAEIWWPEWGKNSAVERSYLHNLGLIEPGNYFNSGIIAARRTTWDEISKDALDFIRSNSSICRYHDQSALNAVMLRYGREYLSPRFNFNGWYNILPVRCRIDPAIIHFSGAHKPWGDKYPSYHGEFRQSYLDLIRCFPFLLPYWGVTSGRAGGQLDRPLRLGLGWKIPWRVPFRSKRALRYFERTRFDVS